MRHISFEESSVLTEFARIAQEKGLVKTAAANPLLTEMNRLNNYWAQLMKNTGGDVTKSKAEFNKELVRTVNQLKATYKDPKSLAFIQQFEQNAKKIAEPEVASVQSAEDDGCCKKCSGGECDGKCECHMGEEYLKRYDATGEELGRYEDTKKLPDGSAERDYKLEHRNFLKDLSDSRKKASKVDKLYDVSGETGEKLVDTAHPEGSPKVDIKNTKEVVETITDQQKEDLKVVEKNPTGKYAELTELYVSLKKAGATVKQLQTVKDHIDKVAHLDTVINHVLVVLADELDSMGLSKYADMVDGLIKQAEDPSLRLPSDFTMGKDLMPENKEPYMKPYQAVPQVTVPGLTVNIPQQQETAKKMQDSKRARAIEVGKKFQALYNQYAEAAGKPKLRTDGLWDSSVNDAFRTVGGFAGLKKLPPQMPTITKTELYESGPAAAGPSIPQAKTDSGYRSPNYIKI